MKTRALSIAVATLVLFGILTPAAGAQTASPGGASKRRRSSWRGSPRWQRLYNAGARPQRLLWASTGTKDPNASEILYVEALAAPFTVNTMPEGTLKALGEHASLGPTLPVDGGDPEEALGKFAQAGIDVDALAAQLQDEGAKSFVKSWTDLMAVIRSKCADRSSIRMRLEAINR